MNFISKVFSKDYSKERINPFGDSITHIDYPNCGLHELLKKSIDKFPKLPAFDYFGKVVTNDKFYEKIVTAARALKVIGVEKNDRITICMPNTPEALIMFYAVNMVGATANMIHPLSSENEIEFYIDVASSKYILAVDLLKAKVLKAIKNHQVERVILASVSDSMPVWMKTAYQAMQYIKKDNNMNLDEVDESNVIKWNDFYNLGFNYKKEDYFVKLKGNEEAVIIYSGGTTGRPKGVRLSNLNINAMALQAISRVESAKPGNSILSILPMFHGFGLAAGFHTVLLAGVKCILIPQFKPNEFAKLIKKNKPNLLLGVPTMYEALANSDESSKTYLKSVTDCICGGDTLKPELRRRVNNYLSAHGSSAQLRVGYGLSESVAVCILSPSYFYKEGAIGISMPDTQAKIVKIDSNKECKPNKKGEICISGPTVMMGYLNEEEETNNTLKIHPDGKTWLHTGDIGFKNREGIIFFESRLKRMIVTSGYNVYPQYLEQIITSHPAVYACVVVGVPHPYKKQVPVANILLNDNYEPSEELTKDIKKYCEKSIAKYSMPFAYEYIKTIPKTLIGKVNFKKLEEENTKKYSRVKK